MLTMDTVTEAQQDALRRRVEERTAERRRRIEAICAPGGLATADEPRRVAARIDRLSRYYADIRPVQPSALEAGDKGALAAAGAILERTINTPDLVSVVYLEAGVSAARAVARMVIRDAAGRLTGYGTGSLVSPRLLLTNHHVLEDADTAAASIAEFNYENGVSGQPLTPTVVSLDPATFFLTDEQLDFTLVAVAGGTEAVSEFGFNRLVAAEGKAIAGDFVTIVQHPNGEMKQVALRDNRIVDVLERFLHYEADTAPGSSGSPVFNDQWEVVALHHAGIPAPEQRELGGYVNEGIRVSRLLEFIAAQTVSANQRALVDELLGPEKIVVRGVASTPPQSSALPQSLPVADGNVAKVTIPVELSLKVTSAAPVAIPVAMSNGAAAAVGAEALVIDPDYSDRKGYDPDFLGVSVPMPALSEKLVPLAAVSQAPTAEPPYVLPYHHFSIIVNARRRLAFLTAVNVDGASSRRLKREDDHWSFDPRIPQDQQTGYELYAKNDLDLGHLVRRLDPGWGESLETTKAPVADTFHFTNCTPQHKDFNRASTLWEGLEDYILENAENYGFKVNVFTGPVLADDDRQYRGIQLPRQFWKVVAMAKSSGELSVTAYLLSQADLIGGLEIAETEFHYDQYGTFQVPVSRIEELTGISFGPLAAADPLADREEAAAVIELRSPSRIVL